MAATNTMNMKSDVDSFVDAARYTTGVRAYESLVKAWELIVEENTSQLHLVTDAQQKQWKQFQKAFTEKLIKAGKTGVNIGWDKQELDALASTLGSPKHVAGDVLQEELRAAELKAERQREKVFREAELKREQDRQKKLEREKVSGFIGRLKNLLK